MAQANISEVRTCIKQCLSFCETNSDREYCQRHGPKFEDVLDRLESSRLESDEYYKEWRAAIKEQHIKWREVSEELADLQDELERVNAVGFPDQQTRYWDEERLAEVVGEMVDFLESNADDIDIDVEDAVERLERKVDSARETIEREQETRDAYKRIVKKRSEAMQDAAVTIGDFRDELRQVLGADHDEYQSIRWPYSVAPDESLF